MGLASIKPVSGTLLARLFLKEAVGVFEVLNLVLVVTGLCLVVQPSFMFGDTGQQYDQHMMLTALAVVVANALGGGGAGAALRARVRPGPVGDRGGGGGRQPHS